MLPRCTPTPGLGTPAPRCRCLRSAEGRAGAGLRAAAGAGRARRGRLELPLRGSAPTAVASPLRDRPALCRATGGCRRCLLELSLRGSAPHGGDHAHQATIPPQSGNHVFSAAATRSPGQLRGLPAAALAELSLLGTARPQKKPRPLITATPASSGKGGSCVALKAEAASAWLLLFGGSLASQPRQFRPRPHIWGLRACQTTPTAKTAPNPASSSPSFSTFHSSSALLERSVAGL